MILSSIFSKYKRPGATMAGIFSVALSSVLLLCGAGSVPIENLLPQGAMQGDLNAGGHSLTNVVSITDTNGAPLTGGGSITVGTNATGILTSSSGTLDLANAVNTPSGLAQFDGGGNIVLPGTLQAGPSATVPEYTPFTLFYDSSGDNTEAPLVVMADTNIYGSSNGLVLSNPTNASSWSFALLDDNWGTTYGGNPTYDGAFIFNCAGLPTLFIFGKDGGFYIGNGSSQRFGVDGNGDIAFAGALSDSSSSAGSSGQLLSTTGTGTQWVNAPIASANVTGLRLGAGVGSADTAAVAGTDYAAASIVLTSTPSTGWTVNAGTTKADETVYLNPSGTLASLTVNLPANANSRTAQIERVFTTQTLSALTVSVPSGSIQGTAVTSSAANGSYAYQKVAANTWIRLY